MIRHECGNPSCKKRPLIDDMRIIRMDGRHRCVCPNCTWLGTEIVPSAEFVPPKEYANRHNVGVQVV